MLHISHSAYSFSSQMRLNYPAGPCAASTCHERLLTPACQNVRLSRAHGHSHARGSFSSTYLPPPLLWCRPIERARERTARERERERTERERERTAREREREREREIPGPPVFFVQGRGGLGGDRAQRPQRALSHASLLLGSGRERERERERDFLVSGAVVQSWAHGCGAGPSAHAACDVNVEVSCILRYCCMRRVAWDRHKVSDEAFHSHVYRDVAGRGRSQTGRIESRARPLLSTEICSFTSLSWLQSPAAGALGWNRSTIGRESSSSSTTSGSGIASRKSSSGPAMAWKSFCAASMASPESTCAEGVGTTHRPLRVSCASTLPPSFPCPQHICE